jgi:hypothetical protein
MREVRSAVHHSPSKQNPAVLRLLDSGVAIVMPISSVNLDEETKEISKRVGNLSAFVRECLRRWNAFDAGVHLQPERTEIDLGKKCFPRLKKGCCVICWPDGAPKPEDWSYYMESGGRVVQGKNMDGSPIFQTVPYNNEWIEEKAREANIVKDFPIPQDTIFKQSRKSPKTLGVRAHLARFLRAIFRLRQ